jgi:CRISPR-associated Csx2 family protein
MGRRVLISFIGTGRINEELESKRIYATTEYRIDEKSYEKSFISVVLKEHLQIETIFLIGTMKSIWEEVYNSFCKELDVKYYFELAGIVENANYKTKIDDSVFQKLEECIGSSSKIIPVYYGLTEKEFTKNTEIIIKILQENLQANDEVYLDVTHAFRSLPLVLSQVLIYFQDVSKKHVKVERIFYGMLEVIKELGYAPIVDISYLLDLNNLHKGAYAFKTFGNAYLLSERVKKYDKDISNLLREFSDTKNMNLLFELEQLVNKIKKINLEKLNEIDKIVVSDTIQDFFNYFKNINAPPYEFQFNLAKWHYSKKNYSSAILVFVEAIITYVCIKENFKWNDENKRNEAKGKIMNNNNYQNIKDFYQKINSYRKKIAHSLNSAANIKYIISKVSEAFNKFEKIINN